MAIGSAAQVLCSHMQIDLRAGDEAMPEQVADGDEANTCAHQVRCERVAQAVRRERLADARADAPGADPLEHGIARQRAAAARAEEWCASQRRSACVDVILE